MAKSKTVVSINGPGHNALRNVRKFFPKVTSVSDADERLVIEVTDRDEKNSRKKDHSGCAMAVACKRSLALDGVIVSRTKAYLVRGETAVRYQLPESVTREVVSFDRGGGFEPGTYELHAPNKSIRLGHEQGGNYPRTGRGKKIRRQHITGGVRTVLGSKHA